MITQRRLCTHNVPASNRLFHCLCRPADWGDLWCHPLFATSTHSWGAHRSDPVDRRCPTARTDGFAATRPKALDSPNAGTQLQCPGSRLPRKLSQMASEIPSRIECICSLTQMALYPCCTKGQNARMYKRLLSCLSQSRQLASLLGLVGKRRFGSSMATFSLPSVCPGESQRSSCCHSLYVVSTAVMKKISQSSTATFDEPPRHALRSLSQDEMYPMRSLSFGYNAQLLDVFQLSAI